MWKACLNFFLSSLLTSHLWMLLHMTWDTLAVRFDIAHRILLKGAFINGRIWFIGWDACCIGNFSVNSDLRLCCLNVSNLLMEDSDNLLPTKSPPSLVARWRALGWSWPVYLCWVIAANSAGWNWEEEGFPAYHEKQYHQFKMCECIESTL